MILSDPGSTTQYGWSRQWNKCFHFLFMCLTRQDIANSWTETGWCRAMWSCLPCSTPWSWCSSTHNSEGAAARHVSLLQKFKIFHKTFKIGPKLWQPCLQSYSCFSNYLTHPRDTMLPGRSTLKEPDGLSVCWNFHAFQLTHSQDMHLLNIRLCKETMFRKVQW